MHVPGVRTSNPLKNVWDGSVLRELSAPNRFFSDRHNLSWQERHLTPAFV